VKVIIIRQTRQYNNTKREVELETHFVEEAAKLRKPYEIKKPKRGFPYKVLQTTLFVREVSKITSPIDDYPNIPHTLD
jgi:hypothetical protein